MFLISLFHPYVVLDAKWVQRWTLLEFPLFRAFAIPIIGIKQYFVTHEQEEMDENEISELSELNDDDEDCCLNCRWGGFFLVCESCREEEVVVDVFAAKECVMSPTRVEYEDDELDTEMVEHDEFNDMPIVFNIEDPMPAHTVVDFDFEVGEQDNSEEEDADNDNVLVVTQPLLCTHCLPPSHSQFPQTELMELNMSLLLDTLSGV